MCSDLRRNYSSRANLASGPLINAANVSEAPAEFAAFGRGNLNFSPSTKKRQLSVLLNFFFPFIDIKFFFLKFKTSVLSIAFLNELKLLKKPFFFVQKRRRSCNFPP